MGVEWGEDAIVIKPYRATRTLRNLRRHGAAVVNLTDDILVFTQAALGDPQPPTRPAVAVEGAVLADACSWREVAVDAIDATGPRPGDDARRRPGRGGASSSASTARVTRSSRPRSSRRACAVSPRRRSAPSSAG